MMFAYVLIYMYSIAAEIVAGIPCEIEVFTGSQPLGITVDRDAISFQVKAIDTHKVTRGEAGHAAKDQVK